MKLIWALWLLAIIVTFTVLELVGYVRAGVPGTLSYFMTNLGREWPPILVVYGILLGGLAVHFWWARSY